MRSETGLSASALVLHSVAQVGWILFLVWKHFNMLSFILAKRFKILRFPDKTNNKSVVETESGQDANAGAVSLARYLYSLCPERFPLDPQLQFFDWIVLPPLRQLQANLIHYVPLLLNLVLTFDGGFLAARTYLIDRLVRDALEVEPHHPLQASEDQDQQPLTSRQICSSSPSDPSSVLEAAGSNWSTTVARRRYRQILILGAGYDSRGCRFQKLRRNRDGQIDVWVIEVDQAAVQRKKLSRMRQALGDDKFDQVTEGVEYVECNFDYPDALTIALKKSSKHFDPSLSTFVLLEGLSYYLPIAAFEETLTILSKLRKEGCSSPHKKGPPSEWKLVFDFTDVNIFLPTASRGQRFFLEFIAALNAPFVSGLPRQQTQFELYLKRFGLHGRQVWDLMTTMEELFSGMSRVHSDIPIFLADCDWVN